MANKTNWQKAQRAASAPEARAKAAATWKRKRAEKEAALLAHAKMVTGDEPQSMSIPLDMIPGDRPKKRKAKVAKVAKPAKGSPSRQEVVLALLKYLNGE